MSKRGRVLHVWVGCAALIASAPASAQIELRGRIVDARAEPAVGARVCRGWRFPDPTGNEKDAPPVPHGTDDLHQPMVVDERGEFTGGLWGESVFFALDAAGLNGALVHVDPEQPTKLLEAKLEPLIEVRARFDVKAAGEPPKQTALWFSTPPAKTIDFLAVCFSSAREFRVRIPPGEYYVWYSTDSVDLSSMIMLREEPLVIAAGQGPVDLGSFELALPLVAHPVGIVRDADGKPVSGAEIGEALFGVEGGMGLTNAFRSDDAGRFRGSIEVYDLEQELPLVALDNKRERAALTFWTPKQADEELELRLEPAIRVHGSLVTSGSQQPPEWSMVYVSTSRSSVRTSVPEGGVVRIEQYTVRDVRIGQCRSETGRFEFRLPSGSYKLSCYGTNTTKVKRDVELTAAQLDLDLGVIELPQTIIAQNVGKEALGWHVTDARGVAKDVQLSDFRGKWVLLEFWGFW